MGNTTSTCPMTTPFLEADGFEPVDLTRSNVSLSAGGGNLYPNITHVNATAGTDEKAWTIAAYPDAGAGPILTFQAEDDSGYGRHWMAVWRAGNAAYKIEIVPPLNLVGSLTGADASFATCEVDGSPVRTFANSTGGGGGGIPYPTTAGLAVYNGSGWGPSMPMDSAHNVTMPAAMKVQGQMSAYGLTLPLDLSQSNITMSAGASNSIPNLLFVNAGSGTNQNAWTIAAFPDTGQGPILSFATQDDAGNATHWMAVWKAAGVATKIEFIPPITHNVKNVTPLNTDGTFFVGYNSNFNVMGPGSSFGNIGSWTVAAAQSSTFYTSQRGISQNRTGYMEKHAVGDTAGFYHYIWTDGGIYGQSDEGATAATMELSETTDYFKAHVTATTGIGDTAPTFSDGSSSMGNHTTDGAFMLNLNHNVYSGHLAGNGNSNWNSTFLFQIPTTGSIPLSTKIAKVTIGTQLTFSGVQSDGGYIISGANSPNGRWDNLNGFPITITGFTHSGNNGTFTAGGSQGNILYTSNSGFVAETHAGSGASPVIIRPNGAVNNAANPASVAIQVQPLAVGSVAATDFVVGDIVTIAGDLFPQQSKVTAATPSSGGFQNITLLIRNPNQRAYLFCGGVQGSYISSLENYNFSHMRSSYYAYGSSDGTHLIYGYVNGGTTVNHNNQIPQTLNEAMTTSGQIDCYLGAEVVCNNDLLHGCTLEVNRVPWAIGDPVENPHFPVFGGNALWVTKYQITPTNSSFGSNLAIFSAGGPGYGGVGCGSVSIVNNNPASYYTVGGGPLQAPQGLHISGPYNSCIVMQAQTNSPMILVEGTQTPATALTDRQVLVDFGYLEASTIAFVGPGSGSPDSGYYEFINIKVLAATNLAGPTTVNNITSTGTANLHVVNIDNVLTTSANASIAWGLTVGGDISAAGNLTVTGTTTTNGPFNADYGLAVNGNATVTGTLQVNSGFYTPVQCTAGYFLAGTSDTSYMLHLSSNSPNQAAFDCLDDTQSSQVWWRTPLKAWQVVLAGASTSTPSAFYIRNHTDNITALTLVPSGDATFGGNVTIPGNLSVTGNSTVTGTKTFAIPHPHNKRKTLKHACLEGPEAALVYRGEATTQAGAAQVTLPDYFEAMNRAEGRTVQLTQVFEKAGEHFAVLMASRVKKGIFKIRSSVPSVKVCWEVMGVRADVPPLQVVS